MSATTAAAGTSASAQFRDLASKSSGAVLASVLGQITQHPEIFVFGEFLALDSVRAAAGSKEHALLELFAYDRYEHYIGTDQFMCALFLFAFFTFFFFFFFFFRQRERRRCQHSQQRKRKN
jgi:hypothetical protein